MFGGVNIPECVPVQRKLFVHLLGGLFFLSEFGSLNTFLPDHQNITYFVFVIFSYHIFHRDAFVGLGCFEQNCLMFID